MNFIFLWSASVVFALLSAGSVERARGAGSYPQRVCVGGPEHLGGSKIFARCCLMSVGHTLCVPGDIEEDRAVISGSEVSLTLSSNDSCVLVTWHSSQCVKGRCIVAYSLLGYEYYRQHVRDGVTMAVVDTRQLLSGIYVLRLETQEGRPLGYARLVVAPGQEERS